MSQFGFGIPVRQTDQHDRDETIGTTMVARIIRLELLPVSMSKQRDDGGLYTSTVSDEELLHFFDSAQRDFYSAREIATEFSFDRSQAHRRLSQLAEDGELERVKVGKRNVVWWRPRDVVVLIEENDGYSIVDPGTGVASQGETRDEALRMLAEAIEVHAGKSEITSEEIYDELGIDPAEIEQGATPPWE